MKKNYSILVFAIFFSTIVSAADKYWVGPTGGNWADDKNWSLSSVGSGGAGQPVSSDNVIFGGSALVNVNTSATVYSLKTSLGTNTVTLYTSTGSTITILNNLKVEPFSILKDSTSTNVSFNIIFSGANHATGLILGDWIFEGGTAINAGGGIGARFTAEDGSLVSVSSSGFFSGIGGRIIFKNNTGIISSTVASLKFSYGTSYILDNNLNAAIPAATWAKDSLQDPNPYLGVLGAAAATVQISGNLSQLQFSGGIPIYGRMVIDLYALTADANLSLPDGSKIRGNLEIVNTNGHTLTLLASTSVTSSVQVEIGTTEVGTSFGGNLNISGATTKVALARAPASAPATSYKLLVNKSYNQSGGNFSLQDYDNATGSATLDIKDNLTQTGGTFITNSISTNAAAKFMVVMDDPNFVTGPSGYFSSGRTISMSGGTIDNGRHVVTLKIDHTVYNINGYESLTNGVTLMSPLEVGRLELARSPLTTSSVNILTVSDPGVNSITVGGTGKSYVNGPLKRATNSTASYSFPTGKGNSPVSSYYFDSCSVVPALATSSVYQAEYFNAGYSDPGFAAPLKGIATNQYWDISKISGSDAQVRLTTNTAVSGASAGDGLIVAHYEGGHWIPEAGTILSPGNVTSGSVLSKQLSSFSPFTIGYANPGSITPATGSGLSYKFYQGVYSNLPDFNALVPTQSGTSSNVDIGIRPTGIDDGFAFIWQGYIAIPTPGTYTFETVSDDGSRLYFNTPYNANAAALVDNGGVHAAQSATGTINITSAGNYPIAITYFENSGGQSMQVYWSGPGITRQLIPDAAFKAAVQPAAGLTYKFYQGTFATLPDFSALTPSITGISTNVNIGVRPAGIDDAFAFTWQGYINMPSAGTYTFETVSDDGSKLYFNTPYSVNANALVNNDGIHSFQSATGTVTIPTAGLYPITITFFENSGDQNMQVYWSGPGFTRQQVPDAAFASIAAAPAVNGLHYSYYEGVFSSLPDYSTLTPVKTGTSSNTDITIRPANVNDHFAFKWDGYITIPTAGTYTFETISDDGSKVYFNMPYAANALSLVNNDGIHSATSASGTVTVPVAGVYPISITFFENDGGETMQLYWSGPGISRQQVPDAAFSTINAIANSATASVKTGNLPGLTQDNAGISVTPKIYPNPFIESFTIDYNNVGSVKNKVSIGIYDLDGKLVYGYEPMLIAGYNRWNINLAGHRLAPGVYIAKLTVNGLPAKTVKLVKIK